MPNNNTTGLLGLWVIIPDGDGYSLAGRITASIGDHHHLIRMNGPMPASKLVTSDALCAAETFIFDTEDELLAWLEPDDDKPRVVPMRRPS
jgi:hypothetical protein